MLDIKENKEMQKARKELQEMLQELQTNTDSDDTDMILYMIDRCYYDLAIATYNSKHLTKREQHLQATAFLNQGAEYGIKSVVAYVKEHMDSIDKNSGELTAANTISLLIGQFDFLKSNLGSKTAQQLCDIAESYRKNILCNGRRGEILYGKYGYIHNLFKDTGFFPAALRVQIQLFVIKCYETSIEKGYNPALLYLRAFLYNPEHQYNPEYQDESFRDLKEPFFYRNTTKHSALMKKITQNGLGKAELFEKKLSQIEDIIDDLIENTVPVDEKTVNELFTFAEKMAALNFDAFNSAITVIKNSSCVLPIIYLSRRRRSIELARKLVITVYSGTARNSKLINQYFSIDIDKAIALNNKWNNKWNEYELFDLCTTSYHRNKDYYEKHPEIYRKTTNLAKNSVALNHNIVLHKYFSHMKSKILSCVTFNILSQKEAHFLLKLSHPGRLIKKLSNFVSPLITSNSSLTLPQIFSTLSAIIGESDPYLSNDTMQKICSLEQQRENKNLTELLIISGYKCPMLNQYNQTHKLYHSKNSAGAYVDKYLITDLNKIVLEYAGINITKGTNCLYFHNAKSLKMSLVHKCQETLTKKKLTFKERSYRIN